jgi:poly-gamma-glutamate synthesis protein (capsule biosynthesis protein)
METVTEKTQITLMAVGDIMLGEHPLYIGHGVGAKIKKWGTTYPFKQVTSILKEGALVFGNLEAPLRSKEIHNRDPSSLIMRAIPEAVEGLKYAGFNVLSLANNHALEHGEEALFETIDILLQNSITPIGANSDISKAREPLILDIKGITIAFLAYCLVPDKTAYISIRNPEDICSDAKKAKSRADILVVSLHWGSEYIEKPSPSQIRLAHQIIDSGADLILGHHPHVLQGVEEYHNGLVAYSLGNFVFDLNCVKETRSTVILECELSEDGVVGYKLVPMHINDQYAPYPLQGEEGEVLLARLSRLSTELKGEESASYDEEEQEYKRRVEVLRKRASRRMMRYFAGNIYRYPLRFTFHTAVNYLRKHFL